MMTNMKKENKKQCALNTLMRMAEKAAEAFVTSYRLVSTYSGQPMGKSRFACPYHML